MKEHLLGGLALVLAILAWWLVLGVAAYLGEP